MALNPFYYYGVKEMTNIRFYLLSSFENNNEPFKSTDPILYIKESKILLTETDQKTIYSATNNTNFTWTSNKEETFTLKKAVCSFNTLSLLLKEINTNSTNFFSNRFKIISDIEMHSFETHQNFPYQLIINNVQIFPDIILEQSEGGIPIILSMKLSAKRNGLLDIFDLIEY